MCRVVYYFYTYILLVFLFYLVFVFFFSSKRRHTICALVLEFRRVLFRSAWPLSPWARRRFARAGIRLEPEVSFQGGDGYMFFATPELALATLAGIAELRPATSADVGASPDPFYRRTDLSLDFYRAIRSHQREHLQSRTYARAVTAFGLGLLNPTGSRVSRRQSDISADRDMSLRQIRAIPHNAILQQLGYPVNVIAGLGSAADGNYEELAALLHESEIGRAHV